MHETLYRGMLTELTKQFEDTHLLKGELVLVVQGANKHTTQIDIKEVAKLLRERLQKMSLRDAVQEIEVLSSLPRKQIYDLALSISKDKS